MRVFTNETKNMKAGDIVKFQGTAGKILSIEGGTVAISDYLKIDGKIAHNLVKVDIDAVSDTSEDEKEKFLKAQQAPIEAENKINETRAALEKSMKQKGRNGAYWYVTDEGGTARAEDTYSLQDDNRFNEGNYFKTREDALDNLSKFTRYWYLSKNKIRPGYLMSGRKYGNRLKAGNVFKSYEEAKKALGKVRDEDDDDTSQKKEYWCFELQEPHRLIKTIDRGWETDKLRKESGNYFATKSEAVDAKIERFGSSYWYISTTDKAIREGNIKDKQKTEHRKRSANFFLTYAEAETELKKKTQKKKRTP